VKNFVLDNDPVPRAMLSVDPSFTMLKKVILRNMVNSAVVAEYRLQYLCVSAVFVSIASYVPQQVSKVCRGCELWTTWERSNMT
jgi:hypothetical protein